MAEIYIVEDDRDIQEIESIALKNSGHTVQGFSNGNSSGRSLRRCPIWFSLTSCFPIWMEMKF